MDTDGAALSFAALVPSASNCSAKEASEIARLVGALRSNTSWAVVTQRKVELRGEHVITLER